MINYSIIIPHYNIPNLLVRCLRSIPQRDDVQVIVVDDGSPNADKYTERYPELTAPGVEFYPVAHKGLAGVMRNIGLSYAKGKWITFLDADDMLSENANEIFSKNIDFDEDIVYYKSKAVLSDDISISSKRVVYNHCFDAFQEEKNEAFIRYHFYPLRGKLFKREFIIKYDLKCHATRYSNDVYFSAASGYYAKKIRIEFEILYIVTERDGSLASSQMKNEIPSLKECLIRLGVAENVRTFLESHGINKGETNFCDYMYKIRANYKTAYFGLIFKYLIIHPSYITPFLGRDFKYILKRIKKRRKSVH